MRKKKLTLPRWINLIIICFLLYLLLLWRYNQKYFKWEMRYQVLELVISPQYSYTCDTMLLRFVTFFD